MSTRRQFIDRSDMQTAIADLNPVPVTLVDAATIAWDPASGDYFMVTLAGNRTLGVPARRPREGQRTVFEIRQDGTGTRLMTWPATWDWGTTGAPTLTTTANKSDLVQIHSRNGVDRATLISKGHN